MGTALIVMAIGLSAIAVTRLQVRDSANAHDAQDAGLLARSAMEYALIAMDNTVVNKNPGWRNQLIHGVATTPQALGRGTFSWMLLDEDGVLNDDFSDPLTLYGIGEVGSAKRIYSVELVPTGTALTCLETSLHADFQLFFNGSTTVIGTQIISANNRIQAKAGCTINPDVEAVVETQGRISPGATTTGIPLRTMPSAAVFDFYVSNGTRIDLADLPTAGLGIPAIDRVLLSANANPFGGGLTNRYGVYVIECSGQTIEISDSRIVGTLVLLNPGAGSMVTRSVYWAAAVPNFPALLVSGDFAFDFRSDQTLDERSGVSLNPPGTPYLGTEDTDASDSFPSLIEGLVYVSGTLTCTSRPKIDGVVVVGVSADVSGTLDLIYSGRYLTNPPPGFTDGARVSPVPGTWRRTSLP